MVLSTIISIEASEIAAKDTHVKVSQDKGTRAKDTGIKGSQVTDLGVYGETFPIEEKNLLEVIKAKLQALSESGKLEDHQKTILRKAKEQLNRPPSAKDLKKTTTPRSFAYDPSITVPYDLKDHEGRVFHLQGTKVNPLETHSLRCPFLFVDGDDAEQVAWAIKHHQAARALHKPKIILVQGAPFDLSKRLNLPIYFDQSGVLVKKFGITQVPARVSQKEKVLMVEEINPQEKRNERGERSEND